VILELFQNVALLVALAVGVQTLARREEKRGVAYGVATGVLFGAAGVVGMMTPLHFGPGVIYDGRSIVLSLAGLFGGPLAAVLGAVMCGAYRLYLGGAGATVGVSVVVEAAALGTVLHYLRRRDEKWVGPLQLWVFGVIVHTGMLGLQFLIPNTGWEVMRRIGGAVLVFYPIGFLLTAQVFLDGERRRKAEKTLFESERLMRGILRAVPLGIGVVRGRTMRWANEQMSAMIGYAPEEYQGHSTALLYEDDDTFRRVGEALDAGMNATGVGSVETRLKRQDGTTFAALLLAARTDASDPHADVIVALSDVTERRQAEDALRESEERFRALFETIPAAVFVHRGHHLLDANPAMERITGYSRAELLGMPFWELVDPEYRDLVKGRGQARSKGETPPSLYEAKMITKGGEGRWVVIAAQHVSLAGEGAVLCTLIDITELKAARAATERQHQLLMTVIDAMPDYIFLKDTESRFLLSNQAHLRQLGATTQEELVGKTDADFHAPELAAQYLTDERAVIGSGEPLLNREERTRDREGREQWLLTTKVPFRDDQGRVIGLVGIGRDITAHRFLEEQLRQAQKLEAVGQLAGGVAHDFNNILQAIMGFSRMLMEGLPEGGEAYEFAEGIFQGAERAARLTRQLLAFSRRQVLSIEALDLNEVIGHFAKMINRVIREDIRLVVVPGERLDTVRADRGQVEQILMNLCVNAHDAMPAGGTLTVETRNVRMDKGYCESHAWAVPGRYVRITVTDTGCGMDDETLARIFDPFFTTKEVGKGTGLGLATVYGIVRQHEGMVQVDSQLGHGASFSVYLPSSEPATPSVAVAAAEDARGGSETILVAEDDAMLRRLAERILSRAGYTVLLAADGNEALALFEKHPDRIDLILSDVIMPKMGGKAVFDVLHDRRPGLRFLFSSGYSGDAMGTDFVLDKGITLIQKPYSPHVLLRKVREVLDAPAPSSNA